MDNKYEIDLSIIIVNWNVKALLRECLISIYENTIGVTFEIIVVDNASSDGSVDMVCTEFPKVKLVASAKNLGFGKANNLALQSATGRYIGLLNPDTVLLNNAFSMMISKLEVEPEIGIIGPKLLDSDGTVQRACARGFVTLKSKLYWLLGSVKGVTFLSNNLPLSEYDISQPVDCVSGACMVMHRGVLTDGNIFDPQFFMFADDVDRCYETIHNGWKVFYLSEALVMHYGGSSAKQDPILAELYVIRSTYDFFVKRYGKTKGYIFRCLCIVIPALKLVISWLVRLSPRYRYDAIWIERSRLYPKMIWYAIIMEPNSQVDPIKFVRN